MRRSAKGFTFIEALAAITIVGLAVLSSAGFLMRRQALVRQVDTHVIVDEALASEMDVVLADAPASLALGKHAWRSGAGHAASIPKAHGFVEITEISEQGPGLRLVHVELQWSNHRMFRERVVEGP